MPSLLEAANNKYGQSFDDIEEKDESFILVALKLRNKDTLPPVTVLSRLEIDSVEDEHEKLLDSLQHLHELDISYNAINGIGEIQKIMNATPNLKCLNLGFNDLSEIKSLEYLNPVDRMWRNLRTLSFVGTKIKFNSLAFILHYFCPSVEELHLSLNDYTKVDYDAEAQKGKGFSTVTTLMFNGNHLQDWNELGKLGLMFPNIKHLTMAQCPVDSVPSDSEAFQNFPHLQTLSLAETAIAEYEDISNLNKFPSLKELRTTGIPFLKKLPEKIGRQHQIAMLPSITRLQGGATITTDERESAERAFIRYFLDHDAPPKRYHELVAIHGKLSPLLELDFKPVDTVRMKIVANQKLVDELDINLKQTVAQLRTFLEPIVGIPASKMVLYHLDTGIEFGRALLSSQSRKLYSYRFHDDDEIHVERNIKHDYLRKGGGVKSVVNTTKQKSETNHD